ncbi:MAG: hypothetical protein PSN35_07055, partial [Candidatus Thioglobus sp.]|uniref:hypothetical protein n=1 Tax=Candidatus Thioglobus sp. TaxID=2026721 RepID=UPI00262144B6
HRAILSVTHHFMALKDSNLINNSWLHGIPRAILSITYGFMALKDSILSITHGFMAFLEQSYQ